MSNGLLNTHNTGLHGLYNGLGLSDAISNKFSNEAMNLFQSMTVQPDIIRKKLIDSTIKKLKVANIWDELDLFYIWAAHSKQASLLNWKNPLSYVAVDHSSPTFTIDQGFTGNGSSSYIDTGFNPSINSIKNSLNNSTFGSYVRNNVNELKIDAGCDDGTGFLWMISRNGSDQIQNRSNNGNTNILNSNTDSRGFICVQRKGAAITSNYKNGVAFANNTTASVQLPNSNLYALTKSTSGSPASFYTTRQQASLFLGSGNISISSLYNIIQDYMTALGANV